MITFDSLTLKAWIEENRTFLTGARIQKIQQPTRKDFVLTIRSNGETRKLYININPQFHHLCFMNKENEAKRLIEIPQKPPMFCMLLRKYLENAVISKVNQPPNERILEFYIETYNELSEKIYLCLAIELMGKHSNVVLYSDDTNVIIGCAHNVGAEKSREREMAGTLPYVYPPKQIKTDILSYNGEINFE
ncbi:NFACT family protein, partial [bacterium]|nr:NFACT family protein [bacterium]